MQERIFRRSLAHTYIRTQRAEGGWGEAAAVVYFVLVQRQQPTMVVSAKLCLAPFAFQKSLVFARCKLFFCCSSSAGIKFSLRRSVGQERRRLLVGWSLAFLQLIQPCVLHTEQKQERKPFKRSRSAKTHLYQAGERNRASAYKSELARRKANGGAGGSLLLELSGHPEVARGCEDKSY